MNALLQSNRASTPPNKHHLSFGGTYFRYSLPPLVMSGEQDRTIWCFVNRLGYAPFPVRVAESANIDYFKEAIKEKFGFSGVGSPRMILWKLINPEPVGPEDTLWDRIKSRGDDLKEFATRLSSEKKLLELFPVPLASAHVQVVVEILPDIPPNWQSEKERSNESLLPSEDHLHIFLGALQKIDDRPDWYSNPHNMGLLPFPMLYSHLPTDRFLLSPGEEPVKVFEYMGRERFGNLWDKVQSLEIGLRSTQLFLHGNMGCGKSHMLAALACLLFRLGKRPVYLSNCRQMLADPLPYIQSAMLCSFAATSSPDQRNKIRSFRNTEDAIQFCRTLGETRLYFIIDQVNALEQEEPNADLVPNSEKETLLNFLHRISVGHYSITSASANYRTARRMARKQTGELKMSMMGGMSTEEMKQWWLHHQGKLPIFKDTSEQDRVEDLTGCIPLLLQPLILWKDQSFCQIEQKFLLHPELVVVKKNIYDFAGEMRKDTWNYASYIDALFACLSGSPLSSISAECFDYRYFWQDEETDHCYYTCGLAREGGAITVRRTNPDKFLTDTWLSSLDAFEDNPVVVGFIVEQTCLSVITNIGFDFGDLHWNFVKSEIFSGDILDAIPLATSETLYIPDQWNHKDIYALYLSINNEQKTAFIVPIQISINRFHKDSETRFYAGWQSWVKRFEGYALSSTFVWIVEHERSWKIVEEQLRPLRSGVQLIAPHYKQMHVAAGDLYKPLGERLEARYRRLQNTEQPSCKMIESATQNELEEDINNRFYKNTANKMAQDTDPRYEDGAKGDKKSAIAKQDYGEGSSKRKRASPSMPKSNKKATPTSRQMKGLVDDDEDE